MKYLCIFCGKEDYFPYGSEYVCDDCILQAERFEKWLKGLEGVMQEAHGEKPKTKGEKNE